MCGLAGWFDAKVSFREHKQTITGMARSLVRRGPDDGGIFVKDRICLIHRRLAVIDPENGRQPMTKQHENRTCTIVYNGELYNTREVREELEGLGCSFVTCSDTEVVLTAFLCWGGQCVEKLNGIFAFAVYDHEKRELFLARDRVGVKPLFLYPYADGLLFASEVQCLLRNPLVRPEVDEEGLSELFLMGPGRTPGQGIYRGVKELLPGECAFYDGKSLSRRRYFTLSAREHEEDLPTTVARVRELITDAVQRQLVSDVPLCCFLSGGLDSSIISCIAAGTRQQRGEDPLDTYSVDYSGNDRYFQSSLFQPTPDSRFIGIMAEAIGSRHHNVLLQNEDLFEALRPAVDARSFPGMTDVDASLLLFCREIKKDFTVALSGECADELFGGYPWYHNREILMEDIFPWSRSPEVRRSVLKKGFLPHGEDYVRQRYLDTCVHTEKLPGDTPLDRRMREMFALNFYWFMQTLLEEKDIKENHCPSVTLFLKAIKKCCLLIVFYVILYKIKIRMQRRSL